MVRMCWGKKEFKLAGDDAKDRLVWKENISG